MRQFRTWWSFHRPRLSRWPMRSRTWSPAREWEQSQLQFLSPRTEFHLPRRFWSKIFTKPLLIGNYPITIKTKIATIWKELEQSRIFLQTVIIVEYCLHFVATILEYFQNWLTLKCMFTILVSGRHSISIVCLNVAIMIRVDAKMMPPQYSDIFLLPDFKIFGTDD